MAANLRQQVDAALEDVDFAKNDYQVELDTTKGKITLDLFPDVAPGHVRNIIGLTKIGYYDGVLFHRVIKGFMIQGGCPQGTGTGGPGYTIPAEFNDRPHEVGTLSMARTNDPNSAGSQFFICVARVAHPSRWFSRSRQAVSNHVRAGCAGAIHSSIEPPMNRFINSCPRSRVMPPCSAAVASS
ncbi:MAG: peptidylprolyl isomerase [Planctomycetaceae bacterium]